jgi:hypothetical protein
MKRRTFLNTAGTGAFGMAMVSMIPRTVIAAGKAEGAPVDFEAKGGYTLKPPRKYLFTDMRNIDAGALRWKNRQGERLPLNRPPMPQVDAIAALGPTPVGVRLEAQPCHKEGPLDPIPPRGSVYDDGTYRAWQLNVKYPEGKNVGSYSTAQIESLTVTAYESKDGYEWTSSTGPEIPAHGLTGPDGDFFLDKHAPDAERYKGFLACRIRKDNPHFEKYWTRFMSQHPRYRDPRLSRDELQCIFGLVSPDGLQWERIEEPLLVAKADADCICYYHEWLGCYVMYTRVVRLQRRIIARAESPDFRKNWTPLQPIIWPGLEPPYTDDYYVNCYTQYPDLPEYHLMFPSLYRRYTEHSESRLFSSVDGICWDEVPGGAVYTPGGPGWDEGVYGYLRGTLIPLGIDKIALPFTEVKYPHKYPRWPGVQNPKGGYALWDKDRLSAIVADDYGQFQTFDLEVTGKELHVNAHVQRAGILQVGLDRIPGREPDKCDVIVGDHTDSLVTWRGDKQLRVKPGEQVGIQFRMRSAKIFGFEWR